MRDIILKNTTLKLSTRTYLMGIVNVTPNSFSDGGHYYEPARAIAHGLQLAADGADILDIGGESTRPGAEAVPVAQEIQRVVPVIEALARQTGLPISIDTYKAETARAALSAGAEIVNDISGLRFDPAMAKTIAEADAACILMHIKGTPRNMQQNPHYDDVLAEISAYLQESVNIATQSGIDPAKIMVDPGIGFGKRFEDNIVIHQGLKKLLALDKPIVFGSSRKSFLGKILGLPPEQRLEGSLVSATVAVLNGAHIIRAHDVAAMKRALQTVDVLKL